MRRWICALAPCVALGLGPVALPQPASARWVEPSEADIERARELYENGVSLFEEGSYKGAALAFERAYELSDDNNLLYNIALAYDRAGEFEKAIDVLDRYRALAPKSERAELERKKKSLVRRLEKQREAEANGEEPPEPDPDPDLDDEEDDEALTDTALDPEPKPPRLFGPLAWALTGTAVVGFGLGTGFGIASLRNSSAGREGCVDVGADLYCQSSSGAALTRGRTQAIVSDVSLAVGAAATVGVVVVVALAARKRKQGQIAAAPVVGPGSAGLTLVHRF